MTRRTGLARSAPALLTGAAAGAAILAGAALAMAALPPETPLARDAFLAAYSVFTHPRCVNCHPAGEAPLQGDEVRPHLPAVRRGEDGRGRSTFKCANCHQPENLPGAGMPPGVANWHMPPESMKMVFEGKSPAELCRQLKDPALNGGRTGAAAVEHLESDPLVLWAWAPGEGRSAPPISHEEFIRKIREWAEGGFPCP